MVCLIVSTLRSITFYFFAKNKWDKKLWLLIVFTVAQFGTCTFTAILNGLVILDFVLVFFKGTIYTYGSWQHNVKVFWWSSIVSSTVATIYNLMHGHYLMVASEVLSIVILVYMIIKNAIASKKGKDKTDDKSDSSEVAEETNTAEANVEAQVEAPAGE